MGLKRRSSDFNKATPPCRTSPKRTRRSTLSSTPLVHSHPLTPTNPPSSHSPAVFSSYGLLSPTFTPPSDYPYSRHFSALDSPLYIDWTKSTLSPFNPLSASRLPMGAPSLERPPMSGSPTPTPARPPRMPRFDNHRASIVAADRDLVNRLNKLTPTELVAVVKDVEMRFRQLAAFEAEEIRRAQRLGLAPSTTVSVPAS